MTARNARWCRKIRNTAGFAKYAFSHELTLQEHAFTYDTRGDTRILLLEKKSCVGCGTADISTGGEDLLLQAAYLKLFSFLDIAGSINIALLFYTRLSSACHVPGTISGKIYVGIRFIRNVAILIVNGDSRRDCIRRIFFEALPASHARTCPRGKAIGLFCNFFVISSRVSKAK